MIRTQIYITEEEKRKLRKLAEYSGRKQSELVRNAIDAFLAHASASTSRDVLRTCRGMWKDREWEEFETIRTEVEERLTT